jgi:uncharacterized protein YqgC (DUF456 family)
MYRDQLLPLPVSAGLVCITLVTVFIPCSPELAVVWVAAVAAVAEAYQVTHLLFPDTVVAVVVVVLLEPVTGRSVGAAEVGTAEPVV